MRKKINDIWMEALREKFPRYSILNFLMEDYSSCIYLLEDNKELRISVNPNMYFFSKILKRKNYKYVAKIYECFKTELPDENGNDQNVFCIISEHLKRDFAPQPIIQSGINLFRNLWCEYLSLSSSINPYVDIENAYSKNNNTGKRYVVNGIKSAETCSSVKDIALALNNTYSRIKMLDSHTVLFPFTDNIGMSENGNVKICNIGYDFMGLNDNYEIDTNATSITVTYNPVCDAEYINSFIKDYRMLIPLMVDIDGEEMQILGQIDTGASSSVFTERLYYRASLRNFGKVRICGVTGEADSIMTECKVKFPNGRILILNGRTIKNIDDVDILIGMDLLAYCKLSSEPYNCGFKYKLIFL